MKNPQMQTAAAGLGRLKPLAAAMALGLAALGGAPARAEFPLFPVLPYEVDVYWSFAAGCASKDFFDGCWSSAPPPNTLALSSSRLDYTKTFVISNPGSSAAPVDFFSASRDPSDFFGNRDWEIVVDGNHPGSSAVRIDRGTLKLTAHDSSFVIGSAGYGRVDQAGGKVIAFNVFLGGGERVDFERPGLAPNGVYNLTGGELDITVLGVGILGVGTFNQSGNSSVTAITRGGVAIGMEANSSGTYNMNDGVLRTELILGGEGSSTFNFNGGAINTGYDDALSITGVGTMRVASTDNGRADFAPSLTASVNLGVLEIGGGKNSIGSFKTQDGTPVSIGTLRLATGVGSQASFTQFAGHLDVKAVENGPGSGTLTLDGGAKLSFVDKIDVDFLNVGRSLAGPGVVTHMTVSAGQHVDVADTLKVGMLSSGKVTVQSGGQLTSTRANLAEAGGPFAGNSGLVEVTGNGSKWQNYLDLNVGGSAVAAGGIGTLTIADGGEVVVGQALRLWGKGTVNIDGGKLSFGSLAGAAGAQLNLKSGSFNPGSASVLDNFAGKFNWTAGTLTLDGDLSLNPAGALGENLLLATGQHLVLTGAGSLVGGADSSLFLRGGSLKLAGNVVVGNLFVEAAGEQRFVHEGVRTVSAGQLFVGFGQSGAMTVRGAAQVESKAAGFGVVAGSRGEVIVEGEGTRLRNSGPIVIGGSGVGRLTVRDGAGVQTASAVLGGPATTSGWFQGPAGQGSLLVSGAGSAFVASGNVSVGGDATTAGGRSLLEVADGGLVQVGGTLKVWDQGTVQVGGFFMAGLLDNHGTLTGGGTVQANVVNRGRLAPQGNLVVSGNFEQYTGGVLELELQNELTFEQFAVEGSALLGGRLALSCPLGCRFEAGQSLLLLFAAGGVSGTFEEVTFGGLNPGAFALVYGSDELRLNVLGSVMASAADGGGLAPVPEPSTYAMLLLGLGGLGAVARRRAQRQAVAPSA